MFMSCSLMLIGQSKSHRPAQTGTGITRHLQEDIANYIQ